MNRRTETPMHARSLAPSMGPRIPSDRSLPTRFPRGACLDPSQSSHVQPFDSVGEFLSLGFGRMLSDRNTWSCARWLSFRMHAPALAISARSWVYNTRSIPGATGMRWRLGRFAPCYEKQHILVTYGDEGR